jgi:hypothetical protein
MHDINSMLLEKLWSQLATAFHQISEGVCISGCSGDGIWKWSGGVTSPMEGFLQFLNLLLQRLQLSPMLKL